MQTSSQKSSQSDNRSYSARMWNKHVKSGMAPVANHAGYLINIFSLYVMKWRSSSMHAPFAFIIKGLMSKNVIKDRKQKQTQHIHYHHHNYYYYYS